MANAISSQQLLAAALYEIRILLAPYLGSESSAELPVRIAAHLAYSLHNDALAVIDGESFQVDSALSRIDVIDRILGTETKLTERLKKHSKSE